jgi:hypothetical protein
LDGGVGVDKIITAELDVGIFGIIEEIEENS